MVKRQQPRRPGFGKPDGDTFGLGEGASRDLSAEGCDNPLQRVSTRVRTSLATAKGLIQLAAIAARLNAPSNEYELNVN